MIAIRKPVPEDATGITEVFLRTSRLVEEKIVDTKVLDKKEEDKETWIEREYSNIATGKTNKYVAVDEGR